MLARWLRLWFGFSLPVDRGTYVRHGFGLTAFKYGIDALLVWRFTGRFWTPLNYLSPLLTTPQALLGRAPPWLLPLMVVIALPFLWIGVSMTMRRAVNAGASPWIALLFFLPGVNLVLMLAMCLPPSRPRRIMPSDAAASSAPERFQSAMLGVAASLAITLVSVLVAVYLRRRYSTGLFLGVPFTIGYITAYIYNYRVDRPTGEAVGLALGSVTIAAGAMVVFALEGLICIGMALPIAWAIALPGAVLGRVMARRAMFGSTGAGMALLVPLFLGVEPRGAPTPHEVVTIVEIAAPPDEVWRHVVTFPDLPPPAEPLFRAGVAAPLRARIEGHGVGAVRYCDFTTGSFVEPITAWDEHRRLAFDITAQAPPMTEWSPYRNVNPPHLDGYFRATHGEFRLIPLPGGRTRLEGRTTYVVDMFPQRYWTLAAGRIVAAIHERVLRHIAALAEEEEP